MPFGPAYADRVLNSTARGQAFTSVGTLWLGLCSSIGSSGLSFMEPPSSVGYARQLIVFGNVPANRRLTNTNSFSYPASNTIWPSVPHLALFTTAASAANDLLVFGTLATTKTIITSVIAYVSVGSITYRLD